MRGVSAVGRVPVPQVRPAAQAGVADRGGGCLGGGADGGGQWRAHLAGQPGPAPGPRPRAARGAYFQRIALAEREWAANNLSRMEAAARAVPGGLARLGMALPQAAAVRRPSPAAPRERRLQRRVQPRRPVPGHGHEGRRCQTLAGENRPGTPEVAGSRGECHQRRVQPRRPVPRLGRLGSDSEGLGRGEGPSGRGQRATPSPGTHQPGPGVECNLQPGRSAPGLGRR